MNWRHEPAGGGNSDAMPDPVTVTPETAVADAAQLIRSLRIGCLVVTEGDRLVGILSYLDLLDALVALLAGKETDAA